MPYSTVGASMEEYSTSGKLTMSGMLHKLKWKKFGEGLYSNGVKVLVIKYCLY